MGDIWFWVALRREFPEVYRTIKVLFGAAWLGCHLLWFRIALPACINAHNDGLLLTAGAGTLTLVLMDVWLIGLAVRYLDDIKAEEQKEDHDEDA